MGFDDVLRVLFNVTSLCSAVSMWWARCMRSLPWCIPVAHTSIPKHLWKVFAVVSSCGDASAPHRQPRNRPRSKSIPTIERVSQSTRRSQGPHAVPRSLSRWPAYGPPALRVLLRPFGGVNREGHMASSYPVEALRLRGRCDCSGSPVTWRSSVSSSRCRIPAVAVLGMTPLLDLGRWRCESSSFPRVQARCKVSPLPTVRAPGSCIETSAIHGRRVCGADGVAVAAKLRGIVNLGALLRT
ncbi:hypothetical protein HBI47_070840 [Parastagonospora nodorum]|nr:hypothetical protein HBI47_070840 [Parastagonospora nodorum]